MYCNIVIPVEFNDDLVHVVVTELEYTPPQFKTFNNEGLPSVFEILTGYVYNGEKPIELFEVLNDERASKVIYKAIQKWWVADQEDAAYERASFGEPI